MKGGFMPQVKKWDGFKHPGRIPPGNWDGAALQKSREKNKVVHLAVWDGDFLLVVKNNLKATGTFTKPSAWGIPTETVRSEGEKWVACPGTNPDTRCTCGKPHDVSGAESPYDAVKRVVEEEVNLFGKEIAVNSRPLLVTKTANGVLHFLFVGSMESFTEVPKIIQDPADEVSAALLLDPDTIQIPEAAEGAPDEERMPFFFRNGKKERIYPSHLGFAAFSRYHG